MANPRDNKYKIKPFMLDLKKPDEKELYEWFGEKDRNFKQETKAYWLKKMGKEKREMKNDVYNGILTAQVSASEEVIKKLISVTGIDPKTINASNIKETMELMQEKGYKIEQVLSGGKTTYELYLQDKLIFSAHVWPEYSEENGQYKAVVKYQISPATSEGL
jgi:hypothetical protein